jgi:hypothetical protein
VAADLDIYFCDPHSPPARKTLDCATPAEALQQVLDAAAAA